MNSLFAPPKDTLQEFILLTGPDACLTVGLLLALQGQIEHRPLMVIDGANAFDPYLLSTIARRMGLDPAVLLRQVRISRVFTCYQLEALLEERLARVRERLDPYGLFLSGPLEAVLDEEITRHEAVRVFGRILIALDRVLEWPWTVIAASPNAERPPPGREGFLPQLQRRAHRVFRVAVEEEGWRITADEPGGAAWLWQPQVGALTARRWW